MIDPALTPLLQPTLIGLACIASLFIGLWLGKRQLSSELARHSSDLQLNAERERQLLDSRWQQERNTLNTELALIRQQMAQYQQQLGERQDELDRLRADLQDAEANNAELSRQNGALYEQHLAEQRRVQERDQQLADLRQHLQDKEHDLRRLREELTQLQQAHAELRTARAKEQQAADEQIALLNSNREQLKQEFQNLAHQIFDSKQQHFQAQSQQGLDALLRPFREQLDTFRQRVDQVHSESVQGQSSMKTELQKLLELNQHITTEASNLTRALKGDKKLQGNWGEHKVELLLEQAGLRKGIEYAREEAFRDDDGGQRRPDFVIHLPEGKHIIIDSKVSLVDYTRFVSAETDEERRAALAAHVQALRNHVQGLAGKQYPELVGMNSPDFVFLFMPVEPAYLAAAEHSPALFEEAYAKRIAIVTSTTLLPVLRVVANLWTLQRQNQSTRELAEQGGKVYEKLRIVVEKLEKLGNQIDTVQKTYKDTFNSLSDGRGSLIRTVERFTELGVKVSKRLPDSASSGGDLLSLEGAP